MATPYLMEKINHLKGQIQQDSLQKFVQDLSITDASETSGNEAVDVQLKVQADSALGAITLLNRRISVRQKLLDQYQAEWDAQQKPA